MKINDNNERQHTTQSASAVDYVVAIQHIDIKETTLCCAESHQSKIK